MRKKTTGALALAALASMVGGAALYPMAVAEPAPHDYTTVPSIGGGSASFIVSSAEDAAKMKEEEAAYHAGPDSFFASIPGAYVFGDPKSAPKEGDLATAYPKGLQNAFFCAADNGRTSPAVAPISYGAVKAAPFIQGSTFDHKTSSAVEGNKFDKGSKEYGTMAYLTSTAYTPINFTTMGIKAYKVATEVVAGTLEKDSISGKWYADAKNKAIVDELIKQANEQYGPYTIKAVDKEGKASALSFDYKDYANGRHYLYIPQTALFASSGKELNTNGSLIAMGNYAKETNTPVGANITPANGNGMNVRYTIDMSSLKKYLAGDTGTISPNDLEGEYTWHSTGSYGEKFSDGEDIGKLHGIRTGTVEINTTIANACAQSGNKLNVEYKFENLPADTVYATDPTSKDALPGAASKSGGQTLYALGAVGAKTFTINLCPSLHTTATVDKVKEFTVQAPASKDVVISDKVEYAGFAKGSYVIDGKLMKVSGDKVEDTGITSSSKLVVDKEPNGSATVEFKIPKDSALLKSDSTLVVYETAFKDGDKKTPYAKHEDPKDPAQTVKIKVGNNPKIATVASFSDGSKTAGAGMDLKLGDIIEYSNFPAGKYKFHGELMRVDGDKVESTGIESDSSEVVVPADKHDGKATVEFKIPKDKATAGRYVVFETAIRTDGDKPVEFATHKDPKDTNQTVEISHIGTTATVNNQKSFPENFDMSVVDTVKYYTLPSGSYTLKGELMRVDDKGKVSKVEGFEGATKLTIEDGKNTGEAKVTLNDAKGKFKTLPAGTYVAYESLFKLDKDGKVPDKPFATHHNPKDPGQTIKITKMNIRTILINTNNNSHSVGINTDAKLVDTVEVEGLTVPGTYKMSGDLKKIVGDKAEDTKVSNTITFTVSDKDAKAGKMIVKVPLNITREFTNAGGTKYVAFETLTTNDGKTTLAKHHDPRDPSQTVTVELPKTGADGVGLFGVSLLGLFGGVWAVIANRKRKLNA